MENPGTIETEIKKPKTAYLFDIDGVLTNPYDKKINETEILDQIIKRLEQNNPVGLNTGRSLEFIVKNVLDPLEEKITDKKLLQNIIAFGEKGAVWINYDKNNQKVIEVDEDLQVPKEIQNTVREIIKQSQYSEVMSYDETKMTMISLELLSKEKLIENNKTFEDFKKIQIKLVEELNNLMISFDKNNLFKVDLTRIAIDIENKNVGKALGAEKFVDQLNKNEINPQQFISFGDSPSDFEMHQKLQNLGKKSQFIYVGDKDDLLTKNQDGVFYTQKQIDQGTLEFLKNEFC